ncbi:hypothetical protein QBC40DRAFT_279936, partial [Triangularia verruculosa]
MNVVVVVVVVEPIRQVVPRDAPPSLNEPSFRSKGLRGLSFFLSPDKQFCQCSECLAFFAKRSTNQQHMVHGNGKWRCRLNWGRRSRVQRRPSGWRGEKPIVQPQPMTSMGRTHRPYLLSPTSGTTNPHSVGNKYIHELLLSLAKAQECSQDCCGSGGEKAWKEMKFIGNPGQFVNVPGHNTRRPEGFSTPPIWLRKNMYTEVQVILPALLRLAEA